MTCTCPSAIAHVLCYGSRKCRPGLLTPLPVEQDSREPNEFTRGWNVGYARGYNAALEKVKELLSAGE